MQQITEHVQRKNGDSPIMVQAGQHGGLVKFHVRQTFSPDGVTVRPTKKGVCVQLDDVPGIIASMMRVYNKAAGANLKVAGK